MAFEDVYTRPLKSNPEAHKPGKSVNLHWGNINTRTLGDLNLIFCGEVDAVRDTFGNGRPSEWFDRRVEFKSKGVHSRPPIKAKWHMQSSLLGVPEIFLGYRDKAHRITKTTSMRVSDIKPAAYDHNIHRGYELLSTLRSRLESEVRQQGKMDGVIWRVKIKKGTITKIARSKEVKEVVRGWKPTARLGIVPKHIIASLRKCHST
ncbi:hypothetical protein PM082_015352 [Marasmius tenuissimus]|nr:hypothetical protein PM082_015352 [Marasmius tenuissimus]